MAYDKVLHQLPNMKAHGLVAYKMVMVRKHMQMEVIDFILFPLNHCGIFTKINGNSHRNQVVNENSCFASKPTH